MTIVLTIINCSIKIRSPVHALIAREVGGKCGCVSSDVASLA